MGIAKKGMMMEKLPKPHCQLAFSRKASAAAGPAKAVIMYALEVKAKARPRFRRSEASMAKTSMA